MGNTPPSTGRRRTTEQYANERQASPPASPLTYGPQLSMQPMSRIQDASRSSTEMPFNMPAQPKLVPTAIIWSRGGTSVSVEGSFDNWTSRTPLQKNGTDFTIVKLLPPGVYQYKFIVDGQWHYDPSQPAMFDELSNVNNVIEVQEYAPENLESLAVFEQPPSPDSTYSRPEAGPDDYAKEPPATPMHLHLSLLNVPPALDAQAALPRPLHVILNHAYINKASEGGSEGVALGATSRYKSKYITTVLYKATPGPAAADAPGSPVAERTMSF